MQQPTYTIKVMFSRKSHFRISHLKSFITSKQGRMYFVYVYKIMFFIEKKLLGLQAAQLTLMESSQCCHLADRNGNETFTMGLTRFSLSLFLSFFLVKVVLGYISCYRHNSNITIAFISLPYMRSVETSTSILWIK